MAKRIVGLLNRVNNRVLFLLLSSCLSFHLALADEVRLGPLTHGGNGCPSSSASVVMDSSPKSFSIRFESFQVQAGGALARKTCNLAIPIHVPAGQMVSISPLDFRGTLSLSEGAKADVVISSFFPGETSKEIKKTLQGSEKKYSITAPDSKETPVWSSCGGDTLLRLNLSLVLNGATPQPNSKPSHASLDSAVPHSGKLLIQSKACGE